MTNELISVIASFAGIIGGLTAAYIYGKNKTIQILDIFCPYAKSTYRTKPEETKVAAFAKSTKIKRVFCEHLRENNICYQISEKEPNSLKIKVEKKCLLFMQNI